MQKFISELTTFSHNQRLNTFTTACTIVAEVGDKQAELNSVERKALLARTNAAEIEAACYSEVSQETKGEKPLFSNDNARKAETTARLSRHAEYSKYKVETDTLEQEAAALRIHITGLNTLVALSKAYLQGGN